ncbi:MAG: RidA family protein [Cyclobacteriaceae bacterium]
MRYLLFLMLVLAFACQPAKKNDIKEAAIASPAVDIEQKLSDMGVELYDLPEPEANFVRAVRTGNLVFLAGHGPWTAEGNYITGKLGKDLSIEEGQQAARLTAITLLSALKQEIGDLDKVSRIVKVHGMVNGTSEFIEQPQVMNGFSDFMVEVFGDKGYHARAAVGMGSLPNNIAVEIEMVVEVED